MRRHPDRLDGQQAMTRTNNKRNLGMKQTINRISNRVGDWCATLFSLTALLLVPHAVIRPIIGYGLHHWIPIQWLALHAILIILTLCIALAAYIIADGTASLRFQGIGNDIIDHDPNTCSNSMSAGIRSLAIYGKE
jgi:hypothetical protein